MCGAAGDGDGFDAEPKDGVDLSTAGWTRIASVDTRPGKDEPRGQYVGAIFDSERASGPFRYLVLDVSSTDPEDPFGNTLLSEVDIVMRRK